VLARLSPACWEGDGDLIGSRTGGHSPRHPRQRGVAGSAAASPLGSCARCRQFRRGTCPASRTGASSSRRWPGCWRGPVSVSRTGEEGAAPASSWQRPSFLPRGEGLLFCNSSATVGRVSPASIQY